MPEHTRRPEPDGGRGSIAGKSLGKMVLRPLLGIEGLFRSGRGVGLLSAVVAAAIWASAGFIIWHGGQSTLQDRQRSMKSMGVVLSEQTSRYVQVIDLLLHEVQNQIGDAQITTSADFQRLFGSTAFRSDLANRVKNVPQVDAIFLIDANGSIFNWSQAGPVVQIETEDRDYYGYFKEHKDPGLFIGSIWKSRLTGEASLHFARRVSGPDGTFLGLVLGNVKPAYLIDFYQAAAQDMGQSIALLRRDGTMLLRYPDPQQAIGQKLPQASQWYKSVAEGGGNYVDDAAASGAPSLVTTHLLPGYPLVIDIVMDKKAAFAQWHRETIYIAGFALAAGLAFVGLFWVLGRQFRRLYDSAVSLKEGQQILRSYADMSSDWFWEQDETLRFNSVTKIPFLWGKTRWEVADPAMAEARWTPHKADLAARRPFRDFRWERIDENGLRRYISVSGNPVFDAGGKFSGYRGTGRNVTAEVEGAAQLARANAELALAGQHFDAVLTNITQGICFFDREKRLRLWNRRFIEIYDLNADSVYVGCSLEQIVTYRQEAGSTPDLTAADFLARQERIIALQQPASYTLPLRNGRVLAVCHHPLLEGGWVSTQEDITERHLAEASIVFMARHDSLTKLPNRVLFRDRMEQAIALAGRGSQFALLCLDLDGFKHVNDTMGHPVGDALLVAVADRLQACVREVDTVARLGGDEFAIIQVSLNQPDDAEILASRILTAFHRPFDIDGYEIAAGISIGVALAPGDGTLQDTLMRGADIALYLAKTEGRGTARFFEPEMDASIHLRRVLELDLQSAISCNQLELYYQPQLSLITNKVTGFEALLRWRHPVRGFVSPMEFIPVAEETGLIVTIGEWVLRTACFEAENWPAGLTVAVNLSPMQFRKSNLAATVRTALAASGLRAERLELEITESVFLVATADTLKTLHEFRAMGISVALDDFGTGYSSLSYLHSFPFTKIKIDQSFVRDVISSPECISIVRAVIGLGQSLGIRTIAEGVETQDQLDKLREERCTEVQGYFFSPPRPANEVVAMIGRIEGKA